MPGAKFIGRKDSPVDKAVRASTIKAAGDLRRLTPSLDSADTYMKAITANPSSKDARKDLELMVAAVRAMNPGTVRLPDKELQLEIKAGSWAQRLGRNFAMAATGVLPDDQRQSLYQIVHDATTEAGVHAAIDWQTNIPNQPLPDHLKRFAEEATKRRAGGGSGGAGAGSGSGTSDAGHLPPEVVKRLRADKVLHVRNAKTNEVQLWTLQDGKPVQIQSNTPQSQAK